MLKLLMTLLLCFSVAAVEGKLPEITPEIANEKVKEIMHSHASYKELSPLLIQRILTNYIELLDPNKTYFIEGDIQKWLAPSDKMTQEILVEFQSGDYHAFDEIHAEFVLAIQRRQDLEKQIDLNALPKNVKVEEFKDIKWAQSEKELVERLEKLKALQMETAAKLKEPLKEKSLQRIAKRQAIFEEEMQEQDPQERQKRVLTNVLKATASALDAHTAYFTPDEAKQFMIGVQQRLFGIGAQLRDDITGFTVVKILEGGPALEGKELKVKDRIIAVNGEPVVGMDIVDAVQLIRGPENTPVVLTVIREIGAGDDKKEEIREITILRREVVLKETRYESSIEDFGDGAIGYLKLFSFYQDQDSSSADDLSKAIETMQAESNIKAIILDLRYNVGGLLSQAVAVSGLFISKGIVVSIKDEEGVIQHLRHLDDEKKWGGPLVVLINRSSASASEIVAGSLQDYGRALIVGDDHSFGKGSFQTFTLNVGKNDAVNPQGEYKVTRGRYYTVSGRTPQLKGVFSNIIVPGELTEEEIGEKYSKFPLEDDHIKPNFDDDLSDIPANQRSKVRMLYKFNLQEKSDFYDTYLPVLLKNSAQRIKNNKPYQEFLKELKKTDKETDKDEEEALEDLDSKSKKADFQLNETYNIVRDLLYLMLKRELLSPLTHLR